MALPTPEALLKARVHLGHPTRKWHPNMAPYIFMKRQGIHLIDINQTRKGLEKATAMVQNLISHRKKIMFVATKKQAKHIVANVAQQHGQPYMTERWFGGTLTNFANTIKKRIRKWNNMEKDMKSSTYQNLPKREQLSLHRESTKIHHTLKGVLDLNRLPDALFIIDPRTEHIAVKEAHKHGIPILALTDTNTNPAGIDCVIPANDDASTSIRLIMHTIGEAITAGMQMRQQAVQQSQQVTIMPNEPTAATTATQPTGSKKVPTLQKTTPKSAAAAPKRTKKATTAKATTTADKAATPKKEVVLAPAMKKVVAKKASKPAATKAKTDKAVTPAAAVAPKTAPKATTTKKK